MPTTTSRESAEVAVSDGSNEAGKGIWDKAKRYRPTGTRLRIALIPMMFLKDALSAF